MPTLNWIGKEKVVSHHLEVPYRVLDRQYTFGDTPDSGNMIIHGDNLEALKALLPEYENRIKCIYIDPPYNTGNEGWVYNDNVNDPHIRKWLGKVVGSEIDDLSRHDKWLCMMYPRLVLLQKLLSEDGAIFISIDDNEQANLKLICDEIFGKTNFIAQVIWERAYAPVNLKKHFSESHDYILCYAKKIDNLICNGLPRTSEQNKDYKNLDNDPRGPWKAGNPSVGPAVEKNTYEIISPSGRKMLPPSGRSWLYTRERFDEMVADNRIYWGKDGNSIWAPKMFLSEVKQGITPMTIWKYSEVGHSQDATKKLKEIFDGKAVFDYPKSVDLIKRCLELYSDKDSIILDSFAGSGTTAHAVLNLNKQDGGHRKFILCEMCDYAENITAERVRRVMKGYGAGNNAVEGTGGSFDFYELGETIFDPATGNLNDDADTEQIRRYLWFSETNVPYPTTDGDAMNRISTHPYYLGTHQHNNYYFYYIKGEETCLDWDFLNTFTEQDRAEMYIIYADRCVLTEEEMMKLNIRFKKIPRDIKRV